LVCWHENQVHGRQTQKPRENDHETVRELYGATGSWSVWSAACSSFSDKLRFLHLQHDESPLYMFERNFGEMVPELLRHYCVADLKVRNIVEELALYALFSAVGT
jgi:hypothetical protein